jgi:hypothetical protein
MDSWERGKRDARLHGYSTFLRFCMNTGSRVLLLVLDFIHDRCAE